MTSLFSSPPPCRTVLYWLRPFAYNLAVTLAPTAALALPVGGEPIWSKKLARRSSFHSMVTGTAELAKRASATAGRHARKNCAKRFEQLMPTKGRQCAAMHGAWVRYFIRVQGRGLVDETNHVVAGADTLRPTRRRAQLCMPKVVGSGRADRYRRELPRSKQTWTLPLVKFGFVR